MTPNLSSPVPVHAGSSRPSAFPNPARALRRWPWLGILAFAVTLCAGVWFVGTKRVPRYRAEAVLYVSPTFIKNLSEDREQETQFYQYNTFVQHHVKSISRYDILAAALHLTGNKFGGWQKPSETERQAIERLKTDLVVEHVPDTYQVSVKLESGRSDGVAELVNAIVESYIARSREEEFYGSADRIQMLTGERNRLASLLRQKADARTSISQDTGFVAVPSTGPNGYDELLLRRREELAVAQKSRVDAEARLAVIDPSQSQGNHAALAAEAEPTITADAGLTSLKSALNRRRSELLTQLSAMAPTTPLRKAAEQELEVIDDELQRATGVVAKEAYGQILARRRSEVQRTRLVEEQLRNEVDLHTRKARGLAAKVQSSGELGFEVEQIRTRLAAVDNRIQYLSLEANAPGYLRVFSAAVPPSEPLPNKTSKLLLLAGLAALAVGVGAPLLAEMADSRIRDASDVEKILGFSPLALVMRDREGASRHSAIVPVLDESVLRLATGIERSAQRFGTRTVLITAMEPGGLATGLVGDLANGLAELGRSVLVIDTVARSAHQAGVPGSRAERLPNLCSVPALLTRLQERFDIILIDGPPLNDSVHSEYLASVCDSTLLIVEANRATRGKLGAAAKLLQSIQPAALGVVLADARPALSEGVVNAHPAQSASATDAHPAPPASAADAHSVPSANTADAHPVPSSSAAERSLAQLARYRFTRLGAREKAGLDLEG